MKTPLKSLSNVVVACALLALTSADAWSQTICDLIQSLGGIAASGEIIDHRTDFSDTDCTTQVEAKIDKASPDETNIDFKIDRSCSSSGQAQLTGKVEISGDPPTSSCEIDYDNPADPTEVGEDTLIADASELQQLILDAAEATEMQFPMGGNPTADALAEALNGALPVVSLCPCWDQADFDHVTLKFPMQCLTTDDAVREQDLIFLVTTMSGSNVVLIRHTVATSVKRADPSLGRKTCSRFDFEKDVHNNTQIFELTQAEYESCRTDIEQRGMDLALPCIWAH